MAFMAGPDVVWRWNVPKQGLAPGALLETLAGPALRGPAYSARPGLLGDARSVGDARLTGAGSAAYGGPCEQTGRVERRQRRVSVVHQERDLGAAEDDGVTSFGLH